MRVEKAEGLLDEFGIDRHRLDLFETLPDLFLERVVGPARQGPLTAFSIQG